MKLDKTYEEKVYAGVLGKLIGVYLGRPFEQWSHERIMEELGEINYYVNEQLNVPLVVTDDDITGTFTFLRALRENNYDPNISPKQIGQSWLNNLIENKTVLWWGGRGHSAEDTAYQNLKAGIEAPMSGSIETNGKVVAEQIGAQIFIDGWALVTPGDPEKAADLARRAGSVSHDGEAIYGAQMVAAMESLAFVETDINKIIDESKKYIPNSSLIYKLIGELQNMRAGNNDWMQAREFQAETYGYDKYLGGCHMIPNHAIIILSLLFGDDDLQKTLMIVNTAGHDTDCNSGNVGCIMGIKNGLEGLRNGPDYLTPIQDRMYCPTANGGETQTDALTEAYKVINTAKKMNKEEIPPKFSSFYLNNLVTDANKKNKIKFNDEVFHQSKVLNYFLNKNSLTKTQKLTDNLLSKMKNDKDYSFDFKDIVLLQSLRSDGIEIGEIDELSQYKPDLDPELDKMIDNNESGMILLKLVEIIGEKELDELNSRSLNFVIEIMNRTKLISLRNELLLEILPLKV